MKIGCFVHQRPYIRNKEILRLLFLNIFETKLGKFLKHKTEGWLLYSQFITDHTTWHDMTKLLESWLRILSSWNYHARVDKQTRMARNCMTASQTWCIVKQTFSTLNRSRGNRCDDVTLMASQNIIPQHKTSWKPTLNRSHGICCSSLWMTSWTASTENVSMFWLSSLELKKFSTWKNLTKIITCE